MAELNKEVLFGSLKTGIKGAHKNTVWRKITAAMNSIALDKQTQSYLQLPIIKGIKF